MAYMRMRVKGTYALLTHNPMSMLASQETGAKVKKGAREIPSPEDEANAGLYRLEGGGYGVPGFAFRNSILAAATKWKKPKSRVSILDDMSNLMVLEDLVPLRTLDGDLLLSYVIDTRRAVIQGNGILRSRPMFPLPWGAEFTLEYDADLGITPQLIVDVANDAGKRKGVGDYRPQKIKGLPGPFGRYVVIDWQDLPDELPMAAE